MKYDRLYNFISPVTGKLADYSQFPTLPEDYIIIGNSDNEAEISPILIDIRLNMMDMRHDIDDLNKNDISDAKFIIQIPDTRLPNAQALSDLTNGVLGNNNGVIEILQRVSGPVSSTDNNIARFDGSTGQTIKDSAVSVDDSGNITAKGFKLKGSINPLMTGFVSSNSMLEQAIYTLPKDSGIYDYVLSRDLPNLDGTYGTKWKKQVSIPDDSDPVYVPITPYVPVTPVVPVTTVVGPNIVVSTPVTVDVNTGDIETPGKITGGDGEFNGDLDVDGDISTNGNLSTQGTDFEDISELSDDFVRMQAPYDLDHSYQIELPDSEPIMDGQVAPPDQRILQTAWRRGGPVNSRRSINSELPITKMTWTELKAFSPLTLTFVQATDTTNEQMILGYSGIDFDYQKLCETLINGPLTISNFSSKEKHKSITIKSSYYLNSNESSTSSLKLLNRYDNGYLLETKTSYSQNPDFILQKVLNKNLTDLFKFDGTNNQFNLFNSIDLNNNRITGLPIPQNLDEVTNKEYVDSRIGGGTVTQINVGTGLETDIGTPITITGTIKLANTGVIAGYYKNMNANINNQGQVISASNGLVTSPSTINRTIPVWGDTIGNTLLATPVTLDVNGNIVSPGDGTFADVNIAANGFLTLKNASGFQARFKASSSTVSSYTMTLPINNASGYLKNNGGGTLNWDQITSSDFTIDSDVDFDNNRILNARSGSSISGFTFTLNNIKCASSEIFIETTPAVGEDYGSVNFTDPLSTEQHIAIRVTAVPPSVISDYGYIYVDANGKLKYKTTQGIWTIAG